MGKLLLVDVEKNFYLLKVGESLENFIGLELPEENMRKEISE